MALLGRRAFGKRSTWRSERSLLLISAVDLGEGRLHLQVILGIDNGLAGARSWHQSQLLAADFTVNINEIPKDVGIAPFVPGSHPTWHTFAEWRS